MSKYTRLTEIIYTIFYAPAWLNENIKTTPDNFASTGVGKEFIRVSILASSSDFRTITNGAMIIDIFVPSGDGSKRANIIADKLDEYLAEKTLEITGKGSLQLFNSSLATLGIDSSNKALSRYKYTIPFNYFGVF